METVQSLYTNQFLREYLNLTQLRVRPWIRDPNGLHHPLVFDFELKFFDRTYAHNIYSWMNKWWWLSIVYSVIYVILIYYGRSLMESRERFELRVPLILWNVGLAAFSVFGMTRCVPEMIYSLHTQGLQYTICDRSNIYGITGYWITIFCISKVPELIDTLFIVLRKQKLIFLHWFHHATVLVYAWYSYHDWTASGRWFVFMNYTVHAMMYSYYAFRAMQYRIPKWIQVTVTVFQLSQMGVGCFVNYKAYVYRQAEAKCHVAYANIFWSFVMYAVYFGKANADDGTSTPFLIETVFRERLDIVQFLVENGYVDVNGTVTRDRNKYTSVIVAASLNNTQILTYIIEKDAELDYRTYLHDDTALTTAIKRGHLASVKLLFSAGASCGKVNRFGALH
ncbi:unnamed protein product [Rotaria magnacalcarata]